MTSRDEVIRRAVDTMRVGGWTYEIAATALYDAGLLATPEMVACVEACEEYAQCYAGQKSNLSGRGIAVVDAGHASIAARKPAPRYVALLLGRGSWAVLDGPNVACPFVATFSPGPNSERFAREHCERLNAEADSGR